MGFENVKWDLEKMNWEMGLVLPPPPPQDPLSTRERLIYYAV